MRDVSVQVQDSEKYRVFGTPWSTGCIFPKHLGKLCNVGWYM